MKPILMRIKQDARRFLPPHLQQHADHANWLQNRLIRYKAMGKAHPDDPTYIPLMRKYMEEELGRRVVSALLPWLRTNGYLERTSSYHIGWQAYGYRLGALLSGLPTQELLLENPALVKRLRKVQHNTEKSWGPERRHLKMWANQVEINSAEADAIIQTLPPESQESARECVAAIASHETFSTFCQWGRAHTAVTRLKRELRYCLTFDGRRLVGLDVANSQPLILGATMLDEIAKGYPWRRPRKAKPQGPKARALKRKAFGLIEESLKGIAALAVASLQLAPPAAPSPMAPAIRSPAASENRHNMLQNQGVSENQMLPEVPPDLATFITLCQYGKLYEFLIDRAGWEGTRDAWKSGVWFWFLYGSAKGPKWRPHPNDRQEHSPAEIAGLRDLIEAFKREFPNVDRWVRRKKRGDKAGLACAMQRLESKIIIGGVVGKLARDRSYVPFLTIHDSLLVLPEHVELTTWLIRDEFEQLGVTPTITAKEYGSADLGHRTAA